jgi:hypothetical protein
LRCESSEKNSPNDDDSDTVTMREFVCLESADDDNLTQGLCPLTRSKEGTRVSNQTSWNLEGSEEFSLPSVWILGATDIGVRMGRRKKMQIIMGVFQGSSG